MKTEEALKMIKLLNQQIAGSNTVKDSITLLKLMSKLQQESYENSLNIKTLAIYSAEMLAVVVDVLEELSKK